MHPEEMIPKQYVTSHTVSGIYAEKFHFTQNTVIPAHGHEFFEIGITLKGCASHLEGSSKQILNKGSVYCVPAGTEHAICTEKIWTVYNIYLFPMTFMSCFLDRDLPSLRILKYFLLKICGAQHKTGYFSLSETALQTINDLCFLADSYPFPDAPSFSLYRGHCILNIMLILAEETASLYPDYNLHFDTRMLQISHYIAANLQLPLQKLLTDLSASLSLNKQYINRIVKKETGVPVSNYIQHCKIEKSIHLLHTGVSVSEAACATGFYDPSHFRRYFYKYTGITPADYVRHLECQKEQMYRP